MPKAIAVREIPGWLFFLSRRKKCQYCHLETVWEFR
jgi:hypothetical protein